MKNNHLFFTALPILFVILFSFFLRTPTFWSSHRNFDEGAYLSLALKLDRFGFSNFRNNYNLRNIDLLGNRDFFSPFLSERDIGNILVSSQVRFEGASPTHRPPLFSYFLMLSHRLFAGDKPYWSARRNLDLKSPFLLQFYAVVVPLVFSLLFIFSTFSLGKQLFSQRVGVYAALFMSLSPINLLTSQRIWAEDMTALFTILAVFFYWLGLKKKRVIFSFFSGTSAGLAILSKMSGLFIVIAILLFHIWHTRKEWMRLNLKRCFLDRNITVFLLMTFLISGFWLYIYYRGKIPIIQTSAGIPIAPPPQSTSWLKFVGGRPGYFYLVNPIFGFPLFVFAYWAFIELIFKRNRDDENMLLLSWFLVTVFILIFLVGGKELRYLLPAYPPLAIFASRYFLQLCSHLEKYLKLWGARLLFGILVALSGCWAIRLAAFTLVRNRSVIPMPF